MFNLDLDTKFNFRANPNFSGRKTKNPFPIQSNEGMTFREALTKHIDLICPVSKKLLGTLAPFCEAQEDKTLLEAASKNKEKYEEIFMQRCLGLIDILSVVPSLRLTPDFIFQKCDTIMPRYYTIASSSLAYPEDLCIAISLSRFEVATPDGKVMRDGLVSGYFEEMFARSQQSAESISTESSICFVQDSNFAMPASFETPIFMVGPGTGVVPFIGFM